MTVIFPEATPVLGNVKLKAVLAVLDATAPKLATEYNAATSLDLSCFVRPINLNNVSTGTGTSPRRLCTTITLPNEGVTEIGAFELRYVYDPQAADTSPENKAKALLVRGLELSFVFRKGLAFTQAAAVGDRTETWRVRMGRQNLVTSGDDDQAEFEVSQMAFPMSDVVNGVMVA